MEKTLECVSKVKSVVEGGRDNKKLRVKTWSFLQAKHTRARLDYHISNSLSSQARGKRKKILSRTGLKRSIKEICLKTIFSMMMTIQCVDPCDGEACVILMLTFALLWKKSVVTLPSCLKYLLVMMAWYVMKSKGTDPWRPTFWMKLAYFVYVFLYFYTTMFLSGSLELVPDRHYWLGPFLIDEKKKRPVKREPSCVKRGVVLMPCHWKKTYSISHGILLFFSYSFYLFRTAYQTQRTLQMLFLIFPQVAVLILLEISF